MKNNIVSGEVTSVFPELNCFEIDGYVFFNDVKASTVKKLKLGEKVSIEYKKKKIKSGNWSFTDFIFLKFKKIITNKIQNNNGKEKRKCRKCMGKGNCERNIRRNRKEKTRTPKTHEFD